MASANRIANRVMVGLLFLELKIQAFKRLVKRLGRLWPKKSSLQSGAYTYQGLQYGRSRAARAAKLWARAR
jgi:hypothetical protein